MIWWKNSFAISILSHIYLQNKSGSVLICMSRMYDFENSRFITSCSLQDVADDNVEFCPSCSFSSSWDRKLCWYTILLRIRSCWWISKIWFSQWIRFWCWNFRLSGISLYCSVSSVCSRFGANYMRVRLKEQYRKMEGVSAFGTPSHIQVRNTFAHSGT